MYARYVIEKIESAEALVAVIGLGYVGLPVATTFAEAGFRVCGIDVDDRKVERIAKGNSYVEDVPDERLRPLVQQKKLVAATSLSDENPDVILICVSTPLREGSPDISQIERAGEAVAEFLTPNTLVVLESTTYPGTTEEVLQPLLERSGLTAGEDFFLAFSPERIDPGNALYEFKDIPKVVGGINLASTQAAGALYSQVVPKVITVRSPKEAELSKLIENTFRHVNIALVNELAVHAHEMGIDIWEAIEAAATKPFGFMPFWPGPGWGGHCVPLDPTYLSWRVKRDRAHEVRFVELAQSVNSEMPRYVVERTSLILNESGKSVRGAKILIIGAAYKPIITDARESPALKIIPLLKDRGAKVIYHDPYVSQFSVEGEMMSSCSLAQDLVRRQDLVLVLIPQREIDWELILKSAERIFDCCNAVSKRDSKVTRL